MTMHVWVSRPDEYGLTRGMDNDVLTRDIQTAVAAAVRNDQGLPVLQEMCPKRMRIDEDSQLQLGFKATPLPDLFFSSSYWIMPRKAAEIFRKFDLGEGALYPVTDGIYHSDNVTRIEGDFFC